MNFHPDDAWDAFDTPFGRMVGVANRAGALTCLYLPDGGQREAQVAERIARDPARLAEAGRQLAQYCDGTRRDFDLPLAPAGTPFQQAVWQALLAIPYGETRSYGQQARSIGNTDAVRAVGRANGANPIGLIIPCHRVIGANGSLTGYGGGLPLKRALLAFERRHAGFESLSLF